MRSSSRPKLPREATSAILSSRPERSVVERSAVLPMPARPNQVFFIAAMLLCLAVAPAWLRTHGDGLASLAIFAFFSKLCHQHADRSIILFGVRTAVCVRCLGIYAGTAFGSLFRLNFQPALRCLAAALALNCLDVAAESLGIHGNMPLLRLLIGGTLGFAVGAMFMVRLSAQDSTHCQTQSDLH